MEDELTEIVGDARYRYRIEGDGAVVERCIVQGDRAKVPAALGGHAVVALGEGCFASSEKGVFSMKPANARLERVELPEGLERIGRAAFRGCSRLSSVSLPDSLARIDDLAFSCTSVSEVRLPRACTCLSQLALRTGPESLEGAGSPYLSKIDRIEVEPGNPVYCMHGNALCRRGDDCVLEAVLCPGSASEIDLAFGVGRIAETAFAGTYEVGKLRFSESVELACGCGIAPNAACRTVEVALGKGRSPRLLALAMPSTGLQKAVFESTKGLDRFSLEAFLAAYDAAVEQEGDRLLQAKLMVARLARPEHLGPGPRASFERTLQASFDALVVRFGATNYWQGYDDMADAGLLDAATISRAVSLLASRSDATAAAYLLELRRERFAGSGWDYGL